MSLEPTIKGLENKKPEKLLYIGNSYLYYNDSLHNHVRRMLEELYSKEIDTTNYKSSSSNLCKIEFLILFGNVLAIKNV